MLAFTWTWPADHQTDGAPRGDLAERLAASLSSGIGGQVGATHLAGADFAFRWVRTPVARVRSWQPHRGVSGRIILFNGHLADRAALRVALSCDADDPAALYLTALEQWGDDADLRIVGEYCAVVFDPANQHTRLSRSPLRAPPLHYCHQRNRLIAASVPRAIFACGVAPQIDEQHLADGNWLNFSDETASWYQGLARVPLGSVVDIRRESAFPRRYYDLATLPEVRLANDAAYLERARELLDAGVRAAIDGATRPGIALSGGLDSPLVAARTLDALAPDQRLPSFTFVPEAGWDGVVPDGMVGDERAAVEAFAALHPRLDPHFTDNGGVAHDHRWAEMFHAMGVAPSGMCNMYVFHGVFDSVRAAGCDRLLIGEWGNDTFSAKGEWGFVEYLLTGRWRQLWRALRLHRSDPRSMPRRFAALSLVPLLPDRVWRLLMRLWHSGERHPLELISPLTPAYRRAMDVERRAAGVSFGRYQPKNRREATALLFANADAQAADVYQGFEQLYGVSVRDPTAYRPFVEFCLGLPTDQFLRDGVSRWLAKRLGEGVMPAEQLANHTNGRWDADWHLRLGRRRAVLIAELERIADSPRFGAMIDTARLIAALRDFPPHTVTDRQRVMPLELATPRALLITRFVNYVEGRNDI